MRYEAIKEDNLYLVKGISKMKTVSGEEVEVYNGFVKVDKEKLEKAIEDYEADTKAMLEQRENELKDLRAELEAIKVISE